MRTTKLSLATAPLAAWPVATKRRTSRSQRQEPTESRLHERRFGYFRRSITLPERIGREHLHATFENGLLEILIEGGAATDEAERIEVRGRGQRETLPVDVAPGEGGRR